jgi:hypothetical protein
MWSLFSAQQSCFTFCWTSLQFSALKLVLLEIFRVIFSVVDGGLWEGVIIMQHEGVHASSSQSIFTILTFKPI